MLGCEIKVILKEIIDSAELPDYVQQLQQYLADENARHFFYENMRDGKSWSS